MKNWSTKDMPSQAGKRVLITGANSGIGFGTALELARKGAEVILAVRSTNKGQQAVAEIKRKYPTAKLSVAELDLADLESVRSCVNQLKEQYQHIDVLINNAGVMLADRRRQSKQGYELQLATNHFGHFLLTQQLLPLLEAAQAPRIVIVSSLVADMKGANIYFDDLHFEQSYQFIPSYGQSKLANLMFAIDLEQQLAQRKSRIKVLCCHPGYTATNLQNSMGLTGKIMNALMAQSIEMGCLPTLRATTDPNAKSGEYYGPRRFAGYRGHPIVCDMPKKALNQEVRNKLWQLTEQATQTRFFPAG